MSNNLLCEDSPLYMAITHFKTGIKDFYEVERKIQDYLNVNNISFIYDEEWCLFRCTQIYDGCEERIDNISIFWDPETKQHDVEVRRIKGENIFHCSLSGKFHKIYNELGHIFSVKTLSIKM